LIAEGFSMGLNKCECEHGQCYGIPEGQNQQAASSAQKTGKDLYVAGMCYGVAVLWKNGVPYRLSAAEWGEGGNAEAKSVFVSGDDVYVAGEENECAAVWKNGSLLYRLGEGKHVSLAQSVFVSGDDVYVGGCYRNEKDEKGGRTVAALWKNGSLLYCLGEGKSWPRVNSVFVSDGDVYAAGPIEDFGVVWKNGDEIYRFGDGKKHTAEAYSIFVSGDDVYVAGSEGVDYNSGLDGQLYAVYWKNGHLHRLTEKDDKRATAMSIFVSGGDIYVAGSVNRRASLWKNEPNGHIYLTDHYGTVSYATSVFVSGNDVYVAGYDRGVGRGGGVICLHGSEDPGFMNFHMGGSVNSVFVK
jgi:WD40 repeat protein